MASFASTLQHFVEIQIPGPAKDAAGQPLPDRFAKLRDEWVDIRHTGGLETIRAGAVTSKVNASIRMRYCTDLDTGMRVVYGATIYEIKAALPEHVARIWTDLVCEVVA